MRTALYYPHTEVRAESLVRTALLTWDSLEFIAPYDNYQPNYPSRDIADAMAVIGHARAPSDADRRQVHDLLDDLIKNGVPETFHYNAQAERGEEYQLWPQKLMDETWALLRRHDLIGGLLANEDYPASQAAGLSIMSMLADVMAGETRARVTDRGLAYATIANSPGVAAVNHVPADHVDQIVPLTFKTLAIEHVGLDKLIAFRKKEASEAAGHHYRALRHNYLDKLEAHLAAAARFPVGSPDRKELDRAFETKMEDDLRDLKDELGVARNEAILSKDTMTFVLAAGALIAAGVVAAPMAPIAIPAALTMTGAPATIGGVLGVTSKYAAKRKEVLRKHPMAYLYEIGR